MINRNRDTDNQREVIGVIPAGGEATRIAPLPCSKELYPLGFRSVDKDGGKRPKVVSHYLLEKMKRAGVNRAYIVLRKGKWDVPAYWGDGELVAIHLAYLLMRVPFGPPYTVDQAYPFVRETLVAFGFPDILFHPDDVFVHLLARQESSQADVVLGLFPAHDSRQMDMVDIDDTGRIRGMFLKPVQTQLRYAWICAVWTPTFTQFMHDHLVTVLSETSGKRTTATARETREVTLGEVVQAAIQQGLRVDGVPFPTGRYVDIGTPDGLLKANQTFA